MQDFWPRRACLGPPAIKGRTDSFDQAEPSEVAEQRKSKCGLLTMEETTHDQ